MTRLLPTNLYCSHKLDNILLLLCPWCHGCWYYPISARNWTCLRCCCDRMAMWRGEVQISRICASCCQSGSAPPRNAESVARAADATREPVDRRFRLLCAHLAHAVSQAGGVLLDGVQRAGDRVECRWPAGGGARPLADRWVGDGGHPGGVRSAQAGAGAPDREADVAGGGQAATGAAQRAGT